MDWLERIGRALRAQVNSLANEGKDPEILLEQAVAGVEGELIEMRRALAEAIASQKSTERQLANYRALAQKGYERARVALDSGDEAAAREALTQRQSYQTHGQALQAQLERQETIVRRVRQDLSALERQHAEIKAKKSLYLARLRTAAASERLQTILGNAQTGSSWSVLEQVEAKILELEAQAELAAGQVHDPLDRQFAALEGNSRVETELAELKAKGLGRGEGE